MQVQQKTVRFVHAYADGLCEWEFTWFPPGKNIMAYTLEAIKETAELMGYKLEGLPEAERQTTTSTTFGVRGCPE